MEDDNPKEMVTVLSVIGVVEKRRTREWAFYKHGPPRNANVSRAGVNTGVKSDEILSRDLNCDVPRIMFNVLFLTLGHMIVCQSRVTG